MVELNKYSFYGLNYSNAKKIDELDEFANTIGCLKEYNDVKDFLERKWQKTEGKRAIPFKELKKTVFLNVTDDRIEVYVIKDKKTLFGQYWQIVSETDE